jgi:hypothetical protein
MATAFFPSKQDKAKAQKITQMVEDGTKAKPPASTQQKRNECDCCHALTILRYYHRNYGWCCEECVQLPTIGTTRADMVHCGRWHMPLGIFDDELPVGTPQAPQDAPKTRVFVWDAKQQAEAWTKARKDSEAKRGNVMVMPWKVAA